MVSLWHVCICIPDASSFLCVVCTEMVESVVTMEAPHAEFITNQGLEGYKNFTYNELYVATDGFRIDRLLGQGGFGQVYMGFLDSTNQVGSYESIQLNGYRYLLCFFC